MVTDHHTPRADGALPDAPIVHPRLGGNPCPELCATAVAHKLAQALLDGAGEDPALADEDLDLVALATVADVVPLVDENRALVRDGLRALARTRKPGLRALMEVARVDPAASTRAPSASASPRGSTPPAACTAPTPVSSCCSPRIRARAKAIAAELDAVNAERRDVETRILFAAEAQVAEHGPAPAYVLAGEDWHPGVIGIVAARIAERHHRPAVLIALDGEEGTGLRAVDPGLRPARRPARRRPPARPLRRPPRRRRPDDRARQRRGVPGSVCRPRRRGADARPISCPSCAWTRSSRATC